MPQTAGPTPPWAPPGWQPKRAPDEGDGQRRPQPTQTSGDTGGQAWNPSGYWPDPYQDRFSQSFRPHEFVGALMQSPEAKRYGDVEGLARSKGVQSARAGESSMIDDAEQTAASQGLGRGYADQAGEDIRQKTTEAVTDTVMTSALEGRSRQYQQAAQLAASLVESNKARFTAYLNRQAQQSAEHASIIGGLLQGIGGIVGGLL